MFRKTDTNEQLDIFSSPSTYMKGRTAKKYEDPHAWHNEFYQYVTSKIDEETFRPLFYSILVKLKWKVKLSEGKTRLRYFAQEVIDRFLTRMQIEATPLEERNKRNNVEASIFQYCFHTRNNKTRYRGLLKTKLFSYCRCMWMNMRRIQLFEITMCQRA